MSEKVKNYWLHFFFSSSFTSFIWLFLPSFHIKVTNEILLLFKKFMEDLIVRKKNWLQWSHFLFLFFFFLIIQIVCFTNFIFASSLSNWWECFFFSFVRKVSWISEKVRKMIGHTGYHFHFFFLILHFLYFTIYFSLRFIFK